VSAEVIVGNAPPYGPQLTVTSAPAHDQDITCSLTSTPSDADGDAVAVTFTWTRNGAPYTNATSTPTSSTVPAADTTELDVFICKAVATETATPELLASPSSQVTATVGCLNPVKTGPTCTACIAGRSGSGCEVREWAEWAMPTAPSLNLAHPASFVVTTDTVQDQVTGLEWQKQPDGVERPAVDARIYCENLVLDGKDDWRLPSRIEFMSIYDMTKPTPYLYPDFVGGAYAASWTSTVDLQDPDAYYRVFHGNSFQGLYGQVGRAQFLSGLNTHAARCVRGGPVAPPAGPHYTVTNGVVRDNYTGLEWEQQNTTNKLTSGDAATYCQGLTLSGGGWRLPTINELATLVNDKARSPSLDVSAFPYALTAGNWSSTPVLGATGYSWLIVFTDGTLDSSGATQLGVRCVR
jgi:hypothetical protein